MRSALLTFSAQVDDYEHSGDLQYAASEIRKICPDVVDLKTWEEEDFEAEADYENDYGECDEPIYQGFVEFKAPSEYRDQLEELGYYVKR